jgi:hypothetical protein
MHQCTVSGNRAIGGFGGTDAAGAEGGDNGGGTGLGGGALLNVPGRLVSCTFSGNQAQGGDGGDGALVAGARGEGGFGGTAAGGGILRSPSYPAGMSNCTVTANSALAGFDGLGPGELRPGRGTAVGGGIWDSDGGSAQMTVLSSIVAGNRSVGLIAGGANADWRGPCISRGYNLIGVADGSTGFGSTGDRLGSAVSPLDPKLGPLQDNGARVPTNRPILLLTHALLPGSPARDAGRSSQFFDQRGAPRVYDDPRIPNAPGGDGSDIGAVEDGLLRIVGLRDPNQTPKILITTLPARTHLLEVEDALGSSGWMWKGATLFAQGGIEEIADTSAPALTRFYRVRAHAIATRLVYTHDFETAPGPEWNTSRVSATPMGARRFLGEFATELVTLQLPAAAHAADPELRPVHSQKLGRQSPRLRPGLLCRRFAGRPGPVRRHVLQLLARGPEASRQDGHSLSAQDGRDRE